MLKKLLASVREYKRVTILTPIFVALEVIMDVVIPMIMAILIDRGIGTDSQPGDMKTLLLLGAGLVVASLLSLLFGTLSGKYAAMAMAGFSKNLRHDLYYKVQTFSFANIDKFSSSSLITRMTTDVMHVQNAFQMIIRIAVRGPAMMVFALIMAFTISPKLSLIFIAVIPILLGGLLLISKKVHPVFEKMFKTMDKLNNTVQENLHGMRVVKAFVREDHETEKFVKTSGDIANLNSRAEKLLALNSPLMSFCMNACSLLLCWFGAKMIVTSGGADMSTGQLTSLISYSMQILMSLMMLSFVYVMITISRAACERIVEVLDEESDITDPENPVTEVRDGSIDFENVNFAYSSKADRLALENVNIHIKSGETIGILGGTGSSKTTLVQLIPRLYDATGGSVKVGGVDVRDYSTSALRDSVSMVLQKNELFAGTIFQNLRWGNENATDAEVRHAAELACADEFIQRFPESYYTFIEQGGTNVSGGQKQRLCIARALLKKPKILILDDSTSAVDTRTDAAIRRAFRDEIPNTTKLIIAQRIASVEDADKVLILDGGRVADFGTPAELMERSAIYQEVYNSQKKGGSDNE